MNSSSILKRFLIFLLLTSFSALANPSERFLGCLVVAYGPPNKSTITAYYIYDIRSNKSVLETERMVESLKAETSELKYKRHTFYFDVDEDGARRQFDQTLTKKERQRFPNRNGGIVVWSGEVMAYPQIYSPQNVRPQITFSENYRPGAVTPVSSRGRSSSPAGTRAETCSSCGGKGEISYELQSVSGGYKTYSTVDQYGRKTYSSSVGTGTTKCNACNGMGKVSVGN